MDRSAANGKNAVLVQEILSTARTLTPDLLCADAVSVSHEALYAAALKAFGGWDIALAHALKTLFTQKTTPAWVTGHVVERRPPRPRRSP